MKKLLEKGLLCAAIFLAAPVVTSSLSVARADGCYLCSSGSSEACKNYCRYRGDDTFQARKECEKRGCKVGGTGSCPTAVNYKVCLAPVAPSETTVASIPWCSPETKS